jgi:hypothetical protein
MLNFNPIDFSYIKLLIDLGETELTDDVFIGFF